jgi:hypothetical protein
MIFESSSFVGLNPASLYALAISRFDILPSPFSSSDENDCRITVEE